MRTVGLLTLVAFVAACGPGPDPITGDSGTTTPLTGSATGTSTGTATGTGTGTGGIERTATFSGELQMCGGGAVPAGVDIRFCDIQGCKNHETVAGNAAYSWDGAIVGWSSFEAVGPAGSGLATAFVPLELGSNEVRSEDITLCPHDPATPLTGALTEMELGEGLYITLSTSAIVEPAFFDPATEAAGIRLDAADYVPTDAITGTVVEQWFIDPFNHKTTSTGIEVRFDGGTLGLTAATYRAHVGSYDDFTWLDFGTFSDADADGWYTSDSGPGLPLLGTIILVEE